MRIYDGELVMTGDILVSYRRFGEFAATADRGACAVAGQAVGLAVKLPAAQASLAMTGQAATLTYSGAAAGWPDASNTGPRIGLSATGSVQSTSVGQTISGINCTKINVIHANVHVVDCKFNHLVVGMDNGNNPIAAAGGVVIEYCEYDGTGVHNSGVEILEGWTGTIRRCEIHNEVENAIMIQSGDGVVIEYNYIHNIFFGGGDPHSDHVQFFFGEDGATITGNNFDASSGGASSCVTMSSGTNFTITNNRFSGAAYQLRLEDASTGHTVSGNLFVADHVYGPVVDEGSGNTFTNNTFGSTLYPTGHP